MIIVIFYIRIIIVLTSRSVEFNKFSSHLNLNASTVMNAKLWSLYHLSSVWMSKKHPIIITNCNGVHFPAVSALSYHQLFLVNYFWIYFSQHLIPNWNWLNSCWSQWNWMSSKMRHLTIDGALQPKSGNWELPQHAQKMAFREINRKHRENIFTEKFEVYCKIITGRIP